MKKKIKSAVISIAVIAVLLLSILIGVKNGTLDKLTKEMPTLATSQEETEKTTVNVKNDSTESKPYEGIEIAGYGEEFDVKLHILTSGKYDENDRSTYNIFHVRVNDCKVSRQCDFDINRIDYGLENKKASMDSNNNFISDYYYAMIELEVTKDINDNDIILDNDNEFHTLWHSVKLNEDGTYNKIENYENVGTSSDNTHGNVHLEKGETKTITLYYLITDEEFENETLAIDFHYYGSPCKGTLAIVHEPEEN